MKPITFFYFILIYLTISNPCYGFQDTSNLILDKFSSSDYADYQYKVRINQQIGNLESKLGYFEQNLSNYKTEKEILEKTYSCNYHHATTIFTILLGIIGTLASLAGFFGIKGIFSLKEEYSQELEKIKIIRVELEAKINTFSEDLLTVKLNNEKQNKQIDILNIKDKAHLYENSNPSQSLEYAILGLNLVPDDIDLLHSKAIAYIKLTMFDEAAEVYEKIYELSPNNHMLVRSLGEVYLLGKNISKYEELKTRHKQTFNKAPDSFKILLESFKYYLEDKNQELKQLISDFSNGKDQEMLIPHLNWDFSDINYFLLERPETASKKLFRAFLQILDGDASFEDIRDMLK